jgi:hypothetical protein
LSGSSTGPEASAEIEIAYGDPEMVRSVLEAISPDNLHAPRGVTIEAMAKDSILKISISCGRGVGSLIATVDDLLSCVQAAERAIGEVAD